MKYYVKCLALFLASTSVMLWAATSSLAEVKTVVDHNENVNTSASFKFPHVPTLAGPKAAKAVFTLVEGDVDENGGGLAKLHDGLLPTEEDQPAENFFFNAGTDGGRVLADLGSPQDIKQVNTYSWHPGTRGPQVYKLYASDGKAADFNAQPKRGTDLDQAGWKLVAAVDTRPKPGEAGGQYGVSISDTTGPLGNYRYLLFDMSPTENDDQFGNTFYSEIEVLTGTDGSATAAAPESRIKTVVDHNENGNTSASFKFSRVPALAGTNAAKAVFTLVEGEADENGGGLAKLNDGLLPTEEDQPAENFFFNAGTEGGRLRVDLGEPQKVKQVTTYSWHPNTRGPQVYKLYASNGRAADFNPQPKRGTDMEKGGWRFLTAVDTRPKEGEAGGQYGVSVSGTTGRLGTYRYLLFDMSPTENDDQFGNTFYSEIEVLIGHDGGGAVAEAKEGAPKGRFVTNSPDNYCEITIDTSGAPELKDWAETKLAPVLADWYPKIVAMLPSDGYEPPHKFSVAIAPGRGVAATGGTRITANATWLSRELKGEAVGSLVHEEVHVVQQYRGGRRNNPDYHRAPGWLVEGIPDYIRWFKYEPQSHGADARYFQRRGAASLKYDGLYRVSANFLNYVFEKYDKEGTMLTKVDAACREGKYTDDFWKTSTGKTLDELNDEWKAALQKEINAL
jgi:hypothetical protein